MKGTFLCKHQNVNFKLTEYTIISAYRPELFLSKKTHIVIDLLGSH